MYQGVLSQLTQRLQKTKLLRLLLLVLVKEGNISAELFRKIIIFNIVLREYKKKPKSIT